MTEYFIFFTDPRDNIRRCLTKRDGIIKRNTVLSDVAPLSYKEKEKYRGILESNGMKKIVIQEINEVEFA